MSFSKGPGDLRAPFGKNEYRRSDRDLKYESYTVSCDSVDTEVIDGTPLKVCQSGEVMAKITSGPHKGKIGPFQAAGADEVQRLAKSGTVTSGGFKLSHPDLDGETDATDFDVDETNFATGDVLITADGADTLLWPVGRYTLRVWIRYTLPDPVEREVLLTIDLAVEARI